MEKCLVSIIIPVYNVYPYLKQCVSSVLNQSYTRWELLLIDDGSNDGSSEICDEFSFLDNRIRVFHRVNSGVSSSRNFALDLVKGEYVIFVDADDFWFRTNALETLVGVAENNRLDIVRGNYKAVYDSEKVEESTTSFNNDFVGLVVDSSTFFIEILGREFFLWNSLFRTKKLDNLRFSENQFFLEDMDFYARLCLNDLKCMYIDFYFYAYRKRDSSISNKFNLKKIEDSFSMCYKFNSYMNFAKNPNLLAIYRNFSIDMYYWTLETLGNNYYFEKRHKIIELLNLKNIRKDVLSWNLSKSLTLRCLVIRISPILGIYLFRMINKLRSTLYPICAKIQRFIFR